MKTLLLELLSRNTEQANGKLNREAYSQIVQSKLILLTPSEKAEIFLSSAFLLSASQALQELHWLQTHNLESHQPSFAAFMGVVMGRELAPLEFLTPLLGNSARTDLRILQAMAEIILNTSVGMATKLAGAEHRVFAKVATQGMATLVRFECDLNPQLKEAELALEQRLHRLSPNAEWPETRPLSSESFLPHSLYRTFDRMDEILGLDYKQDLTHKTEAAVESNERLYVGGGLGVQTSYSTILIALDALQLRPGARLIDLGSGFGRLGFITGLLRPDVEFIGYEYVSHRVELAQSVSKRLDISDHVHFIAQDLSDLAFQIPEADVYYLYDPFSADTYRHVMSQLKSIGKRRAITVATKGHAQDWLVNSIQGEGWSGPERHDAGTLSLFRSIPAAVSS